MESKTKLIFEVKDLLGKRNITNASNQRAFVGKGKRVHVSG